MNQLNRSVLSIYSTCYKSLKPSNNKTLSQLAKDKSIFRANALPKMTKLSRLNRSEASRSIENSQMAVLSSFPGGELPPHGDRRGSLPGLQPTVEYPDAHA